jgi:signal transduction histidine kinase/ligand-binding sensor domain-containing protein
MRVDLAPSLARPRSPGLGSRQRTLTCGIWLLALFLVLAGCGVPNSVGPTGVRSSTGTGSEQIPASMREAGTSLEPGLAPLPGRRIRFQHFSLDEGLSQTSVRSLLEDSKGFIWVGTEDGLNRFDGYRFEVFRPDPEDSNSLSEGIIRALIEDNKGFIWIGTYQGGLNRLDPRTRQFTRYRYQPNQANSLSDDRVSAILEGPSGTIWVGTAVGLDRFDPSNDQWRHFTLRRAAEGGSPSVGVLALHEDSSGVLWVGTTAGLARFDPVEMRLFYHAEFSDEDGGARDPAVQAIWEDRDGDLWVGTVRSGLLHLDRERREIARYAFDPDDPTSLSGDSVSAIYEDPWGVLWIGTDGGLNRFNPLADRFVRYQHDPREPSSLSDDQIDCLLGDRSGGLWIGTAYGGLDRYDRRSEQFVIYKAEGRNPDRSNTDAIWSIYEDKFGYLWLGTNGSGLERFDRETGSWRYFQHDPEDRNSLSNDVVMTIIGDDTDLWVGTWGGGLDRLDLNGRRFRQYRFDAGDPNSISSDVVWVVYEDSGGGLWIGTDNGLNFFDRSLNRFIRYLHDPGDPNSISSNLLGAIYQDRSGTLWVGTHGGLNRFDPDRQEFRRYQHDPDDPGSLSNDIVFAIYEDMAGRLWLGTYGGGLNRFDPESETFAHFRVKDGLPNDVVYGILEDDQGNLWLSTNNGLARFNPETEEFFNFDIVDGLQAREFNYNAYFKSRGGEMFFGGVAGVNAFYPDHITANSYVPPVELTSMSQGGEPLALDRDMPYVTDLAFQWPDNNLEFEFTALSFFQSDQNQYAYRLDGFDSGWNEIGTQRIGRYTNIPSGTYTLRLRGSNNDGVWNIEGRTLQLTFEPPLWGTWWFRGGVGLLLVTLAVGVYGLRIRGERQRRMHLETLVRERTQSLEERTAEIERRSRELEALFRADEELDRYLSLEEKFQGLVDIAVDILHADKASLMIWDEAAGSLSVMASKGFTAETLTRMQFGPGQGVAGQVYASGEPIIIEDSNQDPRVTRAIVETEGIRSIMQVPIVVGGEIFGVFSADYIELHAFTGYEKRLLVSFAQRAGQAIQNAQLYEQRRELAVTEERQRLARELHDAVTQTLFSASLIAEVLPQLWERNQEIARQQLNEVRLLTRGALAEMRTLLLELRPEALVKAKMSELLGQLARALTGRTGVSVQLEVEERVELPSDVRIALYRVAQEALTNIAKHAGAGAVEICLSSQDAQVLLAIKDDGRGFDPDHIPPGHLGVGIMCERVEAIGGLLEICSGPGKGTALRIVWPKNDGYGTGKASQR